MGALEMRIDMSLLSWKLHGNGKSIAPGEVVSTDERLSWPRTIGVGLQHIAAMFGATFLVPILTGLPPTHSFLLWRGNDSLPHHYSK